MGTDNQGARIRHMRAFTVLELLVTLTLAAILLVAAIPAFEQFTQRQHLRAAIGNLHNDLLAARSEAVLRNIGAVACPSLGPARCSDSSDWSRGWIVFVDDNGDRQFQPEETLIRHGQVFEVVTILGSAGRTSIRFLPDGSAPGSNGTIGFCGAGGPEQARKLVISNIGRIRRDGYPDINPDRCPS